MKLNKLIALLLAVTMLFAFVGCPTSTQEPTNQTKPSKPKEPPAKVTIAPRAGVLDEATEITLTSKTEGAVIYYEIVKAGAAATLSAKNLKGETIKTYSDAEKPVITEASTLYAIAVKDGLTSDLTSAAYTLMDWSTAADMKDGYQDGVTAYLINDLDGLKKLIEVVKGVDEVLDADETTVLVEGVEPNSMAGCVIKLTADLTINENVIQKGFLEPAEGEDATANPDLVNLDSIGKRDQTFDGIFNGDGHTISGLYIYQGHQGLGFIGATGEDAVIKNLTITDACVINKNIEKDDAGKDKDGNDDDRFGGLLGMAQGVTTIKNCVFIGVVGSKAAADRGDPYEYIGGLVGRADSPVTAENCAVLARVYGSGDVICKKGVENVIQTDVIAVNATELTVDFNPDTIANEVVKAAAIKYKAKPKPADVTFEPAAGEVEEAGKEITLASTEGANIYYEFVPNGSKPTLTVENFTEAASYAEAKPAINEAGTLYAIAEKDEEISAITHAVYYIKGDTVTPTFEPVSEDPEEALKVMKDSTVSISTLTSEAEIWYEIVKAGVEPTLTKDNYSEVGTKYTEAIAITEDVTIIAIAVKEDKVSMAATAAYKLKVAPLAAAYAQTPATTGDEYILAGTKLRFFADLAAENDAEANVYYQFVKAGETSTLTKDNYAEVGTLYEGSIAASESGTFYCIAEHDGLITGDVVSFAYTVKTQREAGEAAVAAKIAAATHAEVTATADIKDGLAEGVTEYKVTDVAGLNKLAELVNGGNTLVGYTFTQAADIKFNDKVLDDNWDAPAEASAGVANASLIVFDGIGNSKDNCFSGTYDGNSYEITGIYIYGAHQYLGFFGATKNAVIKNLIIKDACVVNAAINGDCDDRFGGITGVALGGDKFTDCIFMGTVGSKEAIARGNNCEYEGGLAGRTDAATEASDCIIVANIIYQGNSTAFFPVVGYKSSNLTHTNVVGYDATK